MTTRSRHRVGKYRTAILWIALNDDTEWLDEPNGTFSVSLALVADIFGRSVEEATADLRRVVNRDRKAQEGLQQARETVRRSLENQS